MDNRIVLGLSEQVLLIDQDLQEIEVTARIDTGATSSSIDVKFSEQLNFGSVIKTKIIKSAVGMIKRPVIRAKVKVGQIIIEDEFTLANRSHMTYSVLIGQNILKKGNFLIDPSK